MPALSRQHRFADDVESQESAHILLGRLAGMARAGAAATRRFLALAPLLLALVLLLAAGRGTQAGTRGLKQIATAPDPASLKAFARAGCGNASALATWQPFRPGYHITVPYGWLNDPHGMFYRNGLYHLFFQYNPKAVAWGAPFWAHVVSPDLAHWRWLPPALLPDTQYDFNGAWSGAVTVDDAGTPTISYTAAATHVPALGNFFQAQAIAVPANGSDPLLIEWRKAARPVLTQTPPGGTNFQFRDTTPANTEVLAAVTAALARNGSASAPPPRYAWAVGTQAFCLGTAAIYTAPSLEGPWAFAGTLFNQLAVDSQLNGQCDAPAPGANTTLRNATEPAGGPAYGGPCNQFGARCRMWEVTDFAQVAPGIWAVKWSDQDRTRTPFSTEWYVISDELNPSALRSSAFFNDITEGDLSATQTLVTGRLAGRQFRPRQLNYGSTYASKFERLPDGRLIMNTWVYDTARGCVDSCSDHTKEADPYFEKAPFKGVQQLPRAVSYDNATRSLVLLPLPEISKLRGQLVVNVSSPKQLPPAAAPLVLLPEVRASSPAQPGASNAARQLHTRLVFSVAPPAAGGANATSGSSGGGGGGWNFTAGARLLTGGGSHVDVVLSGTARPTSSIGSSNASSGAPAANGSAAAAGGASAGAAEITSLFIAVDKSAAGGFTPQAAEGGPVPLPAPPAAPWALPGKALSLDVYIDHSIVEVYALGGLGRVTSRIYPGDEGAAWGLAAFGGGGGSGGGGGPAVALQSAEVWTMENAWAAQPAMC